MISLQFSARRIVFVRSSVVHHTAAEARLRVRSAHVCLRIKIKRFGETALLTCEEKIKKREILHYSHSSYLFNFLFHFLNFPGELTDTD